MPKGLIEGRSSRLQQQLTALQAQVATPESISRRQVVEALEALQESLQELDVAEQELAQQNEELMTVQEALQLERYRFRELFERAPVAYLVTDVNGVVQDANPAAGELLGCSRRALLGKPLVALARSEDRQTLRRLILDVRDREETELSFHTRQPPPRRALVTVQRDEDRPGQPVRLRWVLRDVTRHRAAEEALRATEEKLRHSQKLEAVGRLAGGIAHSFNNLLSAIALHAELLLEAHGSETEQRRHAQEIQEAGERAAALARQLLAFGRKQILQPQPLDVSRHIAALVPMLRRLVGESIEVVAQLAADTGWIHADLGQLEQVVLNLVVNARDAMPEGGRLRIETSCVEVAESEAGRQGLRPGSYVRIVVSDTGTGMSEEVHAHLFEPFFTTKDRDQGSGLGLATVYGIVQQSGGDIQVRSAPGEGAEFCILLPRSDRPAEEIRPAARLPEYPTGREVILLVEDEDNIREPAKEILESRGYTVLAARDAAEAMDLSRAWTGPLDILVTDVVMPGMNGSQLAAALCEEKPSVRVLYISGYAEEAVARHGVVEPGRSFLQKPFPPGVLLRKVREVLDKGDEWSAA